MSSMAERVCDSHGTHLNRDEIINVKPRQDYILSQHVKEVACDPCVLQALSKSSRFDLDPAKTYPMAGAGKQLDDPLHL